ncbi:hypothetical protein AAE478_005045 [Parahypoxylon ruwenzoriense]
MLFSIIPVLALAAVAAALPTEEQAADCPRIRCFDALSNCAAASASVSRDYILANDNIVDNCFSLY